MDKSVVCRLNSKTSSEEWDNVSKLVKASVGTKVENLKPLCLLLQKLNTIYGDITDPDLHVNPLIILCSDGFLKQNNWSKMDSKLKINMAKILSHLSVKSLLAGAHAVCKGLCELLLSIVLDPCLDKLPQDRLSIVGHVYKNLWNKHSGVNESSSDREFEERMMALKLAVAGGSEAHCSKLPHQIYITVAGSLPGSVAKKESVLKRLCEMRSTTDVSIARNCESHTWKHLSLFIGCLEALYSNQPSQKLQVPAGVEYYGELCQLLIDSYHSVKSNSSVPSSVSHNVIQLLDKCDKPMELQGVALVLHRCTKLIYNNRSNSQQILLTWKDLLVADIHMNRKLYELEADKSHRAQCVSRELYGLGTLLRLTSDILSSVTFRYTVSDLLSPETGLLSTMDMGRYSQETERVKDIIADVGRIVQHFGPKDKLEKEDIEAIKMLGISAFNLVTDDSVEVGMSLHKLLYYQLLERGLYKDASDAYIALASKLDRKYWYTRLSDWCKIKKRARQAGDDSISTRTLALDCHGKAANKDEVIDLLYREYSEYTFRVEYYDDMKALLDEMRRRAVSASHRALYHLCQAELHIMLSKDLQVAEESIGKGLTELQGNTSARCNDIKAQIYVWKYLMAYNDFCAMPSVTAALTLSDYQAPATTYKSESQMQQPLVSAISLWKEVVEEGGSSLCSEQKTAECLDIVSSVFCLSKRYNKLIEVCVLAKKLLPGTLLPPSIDLMHIEAVTWFGDYSQAADLITKLVNRNLPSSMDSILICKARLNFYTNKVETAVKELEEVIDRQSRQSVDNVYISATARCLLLHMLTTCTSVVTQHSINHHAWYCQRDYASLFASMSAFPVKSYGTKLIYLHTVLSCYTTLARVNLYIGDVRESTCFLSASLNMAKLLSLPLRAADVITLEARLQCFLADFEGAEVSIMSAHNVLTSEVNLAIQKQLHTFTGTSEAQVTPKQTRLVQNRPLEKVKKANMFGFDSDDDENSFSIKQPNSLASDDEDNEYKVPTYGTDLSRDITASPSFHAKPKSLIAYASWAPYKHPSTCTCAYCEELMLQVTHLHILATISHFRYKSGEPQDALEISRDFMTCCQSVGCHPSALSVIGQPDLVSCQLMISTTILKCLFTMKNYMAMNAEWKAIELLPMTSCHSMTLSQLNYLKYLPHILYYYQTRSEISELGLKFESLELSSRQIYSPLQPIKTSNTNQTRPSSVAKAPKKNRRVVATSRVSRLAFDDSDVEDTPTEPLPITKSVRSSKKGQRVKVQKGSMGSLSETPLVERSAKLKQPRASKNSITVFCDDENQENIKKGIASGTEEPLAPKRSSRLRNKSSVAVDEPVEMLQPVRSRRARVSQRETLRSTHTEGDLEMPALKEDAYDYEAAGEDNTTTVGNVAVMEYDDIEIARGDTETDTSSKCPAAESMRSSVPLRYTSPPDLNISPTMEPITPFSLDNNSLTCDGLISKLTVMWEAMRMSPPHTQYRSLCQSLAILHMNKLDMWNAAFYLMETQAITFSHKANLVTTQKLHQRNKEPRLANEPPLFQMPNVRCLTAFKEAVNSLPEGWISSGIAVVDVPGSKIQHIYLTRLESKREPVVIHATKISNAQETWKEFEEILKLSKESMCLVDRSAWWEKRRSIDDRLKELLYKTQLQLGISRTALIGCYKDRKSRAVVDKHTDRVMLKTKDLGISLSRSLIHMLVNGVTTVSAAELDVFIRQRCPELSKEGVNQLTMLVRDGGKVNMDTREPVIVCLDKSAHSFCWESMDCLKENAVTRMPSIYGIQSYLKVFSQQTNSVFANGVNIDNTFYVLNPDDNLPATESFFKPILSSKSSWKGLISTKPTADQYKKALSDNELFLFLGHGSGSKYLKGRELCQLDCNSAVLLMGCSSGAFDSRGDMESAGIIYDYHIAKCPSVLACLWDVTDKDIDRYTKSILENWLSPKAKHLRLLDHIPSARRACKLQYLVGSASVVYGLPISISNK